MRRPLRTVGRDCAGASLVELAFALPVLVMLMIGILQFGLVMHANGGMRHVLGQGIRFAKVYPDATDAEVLNEARSHYSGLDSAKVTLLTFERGTAANGAGFARMVIRYELEPVIPFAPVPRIVLNESRTAYLPS